MYHKSVINRRVETALQRKLITAPPIRHTLSEAAQFVSHMKTIWNEEEHTYTRELQPDEIAFIRNERFLCKLDCFYWQSRFCWIKDREDRPVRYTPWVSQLILHEIMAENELEGIGIELQSLKARQLGVSREISLKQLHRIQFNSHINAVIGSSTPDKTGKLAGMMEFTMDYQPPWLMPLYKDTTRGRREGALKSGGEWFEFETGSAVTLQSGSQVSGISRGTSPTVVHLSELCEFEYQGLGPEELIDSSLFRAVHPSSRVFLVLESTALGINNWWHKTWLSSKKGWPERRSRLRPVFLPWFVGSDRLGYVYPERGFLDRSPVPANYIPASWVLDHARMAEEYVKSNEYLRRFMGSNWIMPRSQMWFYEVERQTAVDKNQLNKLLAELPSNDVECFQSTSISIFSAETIQAAHEKTKIPLGVYGLFHPQMKTSTILYHRTHIDSSQPVINIQYTWGQNPTTYQLVPLKWNGYSTDDGLDKIYIWEWPEDGQIYGLGADTAKGIGQDRSVIEIVRKGTPYQTAAQCVEFATDRLNALDIIPYCLALAALYSVKDHDDFRRQCKAVIECKDSGDLTQLGMRQEGWTQFHAWDRIDNKVIDPSRAVKLGVYTNQWFKDQIQDYLLSMVRDFELEIRSPYFIDEMRTLTGNYRQSMTAMSGCHDDRIIALGVPVVSLYRYEPNRQRATSKPTSQSQIEPPQYATYQPPIQERLGTLDEHERIH